MNFRFTRKKVIGSSILGVLSTLISLYTFRGMMYGICPMNSPCPQPNLLAEFIFSLVLGLIVYAASHTVISLFQRKTQ